MSEITVMPGLLPDKGTGITRLIDNADTINVLNRQISEMKGAIKRLEEQNDVISKQTIDFMIRSGIKSVKTNEHIITLKKASSSKVVVDIATGELPLSLQRTKTVIEPNKEKIKVLLKEGEQIMGCHLEPSPPTLLIKEIDVKSSQ